MARERREIFSYGYLTRNLISEYFPASLDLETRSITRSTSGWQAAKSMRAKSSVGQMRPIAKPRAQKFARR